MYKPSLEKCNKKADKHQHRFVRDGNDHKHQCSHRNGNLVFPHIINLHRLPAACGRRDTAKKEPDTGILEAGPFLCPDTQCSQHVMDNDGFSPDKNDHAQHRRKKIPGVHPDDGLQHSMEILPVENTVYGQNENRCKKQSVSYFFLFTCQTSLSFPQALFLLLKNISYNLSNTFLDSL